MFHLGDACLYDSSWESMLVLLVSILACVPPFIRALATRDVSLVQLSYGTFQGNMTGNTTSFLGIPYAMPPSVSFSKSIAHMYDYISRPRVGDLRFRPPQPPQHLDGIFEALNYGAACPQQASPIPGVLPINFTLPTPPTNVSEDCKRYSC